MGMGGSLHLVRDRVDDRRGVKIRTRAQVVVRSHDTQYDPYVYSYRLSLGAIGIYLLRR